MELDKEFIQEINKIVEEILDKKQTLISKNTLEEIKNKWNEERLQKTEAILNSYKSLNDFIKTPPKRLKIVGGPPLRCCYSYAAMALSQPHFIDSFGGFNYVVVAFLKVLQAFQIIGVCAHNQ